MRSAGFPLPVEEWEQHTKVTYIHALSSIHIQDNTHEHIMQVLQAASWQVSTALQQQVTRIYPLVFQALRTALDQYDSLRRAALLPEEAFSSAAVDWLALDVFPMFDWPLQIMTDYKNVSSADLMPVISQIIAQKRQSFGVRQDAFLRWWRLFLLGWMRRDIEYLTNLQKMA